MSTFLAVLLGELPPARLLARLQERGVPVEVVDVTREQVPGGTEREISGLLVLGGAVSPFDEQEGYVDQAKTLVAGAVARRVPMLAVGGGSHFVAACLGARPSRHPDTPAPFGLRRITRTAQGRLDRLFRHVPPSTRWLEWSYLALEDLPVGSEVLAVDDTGLPQAVRFGPDVWGFQGHPEADGATLSTGVAPPARYPELSPELRAELLDLAPRVESLYESWAPMFDAYFDLVAERSTACACTCGGSEPPAT